jgi:uncharacterized protein
MKNQLQEQLLKSGLVNASQIRSAKTQKNKQVKQQQHNKTVTADEVKEQVQQARIEQAAKDRELNEQRKQDEERKHITAQIKQLIEHNRLPQDKTLADDSIAFHFSDNNKVKTLYVSKTMQEQITNGRLAIVKLSQQYEIVPAETAQKIKLRDESTIIVFNDSNSSVDNKDDPYAAYQIPDDLMW